MGRDGGVEKGCEARIIKALIRYETSNGAEEKAK